MLKIFKDLFGDKDLLAGAYLDESMNMSRKDKLRSNNILVNTYEEAHDNWIRQLLDMGPVNSISRILASQSFTAFKF
jgi:hypothetical protein